MASYDAATFDTGQYSVLANTPMFISSPAEIAFFGTSNITELQHQQFGMIGTALHTEPFVATDDGLPVSYYLAQQMGYIDAGSSTWTKAGELAGFGKEGTAVASGNKALGTAPTGKENQLPSGSTKAALTPTVLDMYGQPMLFRTDGSAIAPVAPAADPISAAVLSGGGAFTGYYGQQDIGVGVLAGTSPASDYNAAYGFFAP